MNGLQENQKCVSALNVKVLIGTGRKRIDITGQKFNHVTVIAFDHMHNEMTYWKCICDCGITKIIRGSSLKNGHTKTCGHHCLNKKRKPRNHGSHLYRIWDGMLRRCNDKKSNGYHNYGGRGITVCDRWRKFKNFSEDMGTPPEGLSIDRINNNGNYEPSNCRWATPKQQRRNSRQNKLITYNGETKCHSEWREILGIHSAKFSYRIKHWGIEKTLQAIKEATT